MMGLNAKVVDIVDEQVGHFNITETGVVYVNGEAKVQLHIEYINDGKHPLTKQSHNKYEAYDTSDLEEATVKLNDSIIKEEKHPLDKETSLKAGFQINTLVDEGEYIVRFDAGRGDTISIGTYYTNRFTDVHHAVKVEAKDATCTETGNIEYWYCEHCDAYFSDGALTKEIILEETVIEKLLHKFENGSCTECGAKDPNYVAPADKEALSEVIDKANALDLDLYTKESVEVLLDALANAEAVNANDKATQKEVDEAVAALKEAIKGLKEVTPTTPSEPDKDDPTNDNKEEGTQTGDTTNVAGLLALLGLAGAAITYTARKRMR